MSQVLSGRGGTRPSGGAAAHLAGGPDNQYRSLTQIVVSMLRQGIFNGEYGPGSRLNIADLAQRFNVSPVPVREALRNLETEGLVEFRLNRGVVVRELSAAEVRELFLLRCPLEALAAVEASRWVDEDGLQQLETVLREMDTAVQPEEWHELHTQFHSAISSLSRLPRVVQLVEVLRGQMRPYSKIYLADPEHVVLAQAEHYALVNALRQHDKARIEEIIGEHLRRPARLALLALGVKDASELDLSSG